MKNWTKVIIVMTLLLSFLLSGYTFPESSRIDFGKEFTLQNGFTIIHKIYPQEKKVLIGLVVRAGEAYLPQELSGMSHLLEHVIARGMIEEGLKTLKDFQPYIDCNAHTDFTGVAYYIQCYPQEYGKALAILKKNLMFPDYGLLEKEKVSWSQEARSVNLNPLGAIVHELDRLLYEDHPFGNRGKGMDIGQTPFTEVSSTPSVLEEFRSTYYTADRMTLIVLGPIQDPMAGIFSDLTPGEKERPLPPLEKGKQREVTKTVVPLVSLSYSIPNFTETVTALKYEKSEVSPSYLAMGWAGFPSEQREAFNLLAPIFTERLQEKMLQTGLLGYSFQAGIQLPISCGVPSPDVNAFQLILTTEIKNSSWLKEAIFQTIEALKEDVSREELAAAKMGQKANLAAVVADPFFYYSLLSQYLPTLGFSYLKGLEEKYDNVTLEDLKEAIDFLDENYALVFYQGVPPTP